MKNNPVLTALVKKEAKNLKKFATKKELGRLNFSELDPASIEHCIYGQATGNCFSKRALILMEKCAPKMYRGQSTDDVKINGKFNYEKRSTGSFFCVHWSPIEVFISMDKNKEDANKKLIDYLKGNSKTLDI